VPGFVIVTTANLPEAYFLAAFLESRAQRLAMVNIVARPVSSRLGVLARLRRNRGTLYLADLLLARTIVLVQGAASRQRVAQGAGAFPEVDARFMHHIQSHYPRLDCRDPHADDVLAFVRGFRPDYLLLAGSPILRPSLYGLARHAALNRHLGLAPDFRGSDCAVWAFALDRPESAGYTIHVVEQRVDAGDVIVRRPVSVRDEPTLGDFFRRLQREASTGFVEVIETLIQGAALPRVTQNGKGRYFPPAGWSIRRQADRNYARAVARRRSAAFSPIESPDETPVSPPAQSA